MSDLVGFFKKHSTAVNLFYWTVLLFLLTINLIVGAFNNTLLYSTTTFTTVLNDELSRTVSVIRAFDRNPLSKQTDKIVKIMDFTLESGIDDKPTYNADLFVFSKNKELIRNSSLSSSDYYLLLEVWLSTKREADNVCINIHKNITVVTLHYDSGESYQLVLDVSNKAHLFTVSINYLQFQEILRGLTVVRGSLYYIADQTDAERHRDELINLTHKSTLTHEPTISTHSNSSHTP